MRTTALLVACVPIAACSADLVTAPKPVAAAPVRVTTRGASSVRGSSPIVIVNGILVGVNDINPADIEQVEIIKGAAATAIYAPIMRCPPIVIRTRRLPNASQAAPAIRAAKPGASALPR